jgi:hypothetical protein
MNLHSIPWHLVLPLAIKLLAKFGLIPGVAAGYWIKRLYQRRRQNKAFAGWPSTEARIQYGKVQSDGPKQFWVELTYTYFIGEYRSGMHVHRFRKSDDADEFLHQVKDKKVQARYNPSNPDESVILDRDLEMVALLEPQRG